jgi:hypothetical protein
MRQRTQYGTTMRSGKVVQDSDAYESKRANHGRLFKSGSEKAVHGHKRTVAESGAWCNDLGGRWHKGEIR